MGVWIETRYASSHDLPLGVTPFVGVWIETLKPNAERSSTEVTPFVGVWIETFGNHNTNKINSMSHPSWVCGLKLQSGGRTQSRDLSHPSWVCGLKLNWYISTFFG